MKKTTWPGNWKVVCDVCGFWFPSGETKERWDGLRVCEKDWETRHPQTLLRVNGEQAVPAFIRKEPEPTFAAVCDIVSSSGYASMATAGCAQAGNNQFTFAFLQDFYTNGHE